MNDKTNTPPRSAKRPAADKSVQKKGKKGVVWSEGKLVGPGWARGSHAGGKLGAIVLFAMTGLGACSDIPDFKKVAPYHPDQVRAPVVQPLAVLHTVAFDPSSVVLTDTARDDLDLFMSRQQVDRMDRLTIVVPDDGATARGRANRLTAYLAYKRLDARVEVSPRRAGDGVRLLVERYQVTLPGCPDWTQPGGIEHGNQPHSNWGCATAVNLGLMVANPRDLAEGHDGGFGDGTAQVLGIERYRKDETKPLLGAETSSAPQNGTGAPTAGNSGSGGGGK